MRLSIEQQNLEFTELKMHIEGHSSDLEAIKTKKTAKKDKTQDLMKTGTLKGLGQLTKKGLPDAIPENDFVGESESEIESARLGVLENLAKNTKFSHKDLENINLDGILASEKFF